MYLPISLFHLLSELGLADRHAVSHEGDRAGRDANALDGQSVTLEKQERADGDLAADDRDIVGELQAVARGDVRGQDDAIT